MLKQGQGSGPLFTRSCQLEFVNWIRLLLAYNTSNITDLQVSFVQILLTRLSWKIFNLIHYLVKQLTQPGQDLDLGPGEKYPYSFLAQTIQIRSVMDSVGSEITGFVLLIRIQALLQTLKEITQFKHKKIIILNFFNLHCTTTANGCNTKAQLKLLRVN